MGDNISFGVFGLLAFAGWAAYILERSWGTSFDRIENMNTLHAEAHWRAIRAGVRLPINQMESEIKGLGVEQFEIFVRDFKRARGMSDTADTDFGKYLHMKLSKRYELTSSPLSDENFVNTIDNQVIMSPTGDGGEVKIKRWTGRQWSAHFRWLAKINEKRQKDEE